MRIPLLNSIRWSLLFILWTPINISGQSIFQKVDDRNAIKHYREQTAKVQFYTIDLSALRAHVSSNRAELRLTIPLEYGEKVLVLEEVALRSAGFKTVIDSNPNASQPSYQKFFRGSVEGNPRSKVAMSIDTDFLVITIYDRQGTYEISKKTGSSLYSGVYTSDLLTDQTFSCHTDTEKAIKNVRSSEGISTRSGSDCVEVYVEVDYEAYQKNGANIKDATNWALALMNHVALFFTDYNIPLVVSGLKIYDQADPYISATNTSELLSAFLNAVNAEGFPGNLAHLISGRNVGGGRAYINVLCSSIFAGGVSGNIRSGGLDYGSYSWNVNVIAHELGHNFGSPHTHDCFWNGNNTQIDDCGSIYWINEGEPQYVSHCYDTLSPINIGSQGTIMSYCHVVDGQSLNLNLGFHPQVGALMYENYTYANCASDQQCLEISPGNDHCQDAIILTPTFSCKAKVYDTHISSYDESYGSMSCGEIYEPLDVWFKVEVPSTGNLTIETKQIENGLQDLVLEIYEGNCGGLTLYDCDDDSGENAHARMVIADSGLAEQTIFVRIADKLGQAGDFGICVYAEDLPCPDELNALLSLYNGLDGPNWTDNTGWTGEDCNYCEWFGIECDENDDVISINLSENNLSGDFPSIISSFIKLKSLDLAENTIIGKIPITLSSLTELEFIDLDGNEMTGQVSQLFSNMSSLDRLSLHDNQFTGPVPILNNIRNMSHVSIQNNNFSGCFPFNYYQFCGTENYDFSGNVGLAFGGDLTFFCDNWSGADFDEDGFCLNVDDCNDFNENIYPDAPELCDGKDNNCNGDEDEGLDFGPNKYVGPPASGDWMSANSWSMGHVPEGCEIIEIGMDGASIVLDVDAFQQQSEAGLLIKELHVGQNAVVTFGPQVHPEVTSSGSIHNYGNILMQGGVYITDKPSVDGFKIVNEGSFTFGGNGSFSIQSVGMGAIHNRLGGQINIHGPLYIDVNNLEAAQGIILNEGIIYNYSDCIINGLLPDPVLMLKKGSQFINEGVNARLILSYGESEGN